MWSRLARRAGTAAQHMVTRPATCLPRSSHAAGAAAIAAAAGLAYHQKAGTSCDQVNKEATDSVSTSEFPTLQRYILARTGDHELAVLLMGLTLACKATSRACAKAGIGNLFGLAGEVNSTGDEQKKLDVLSNDIFIDALVNTGAAAVLVSEENDEPIFVPKEKAGRFIIAFDPLDGSSNIDCNVSTGTIFLPPPAGNLTSASIWTNSPNDGSNVNRCTPWPLKVMTSSVAAPYMQYPATMMSFPVRKTSLMLAIPLLFFS
mmetsp:Transcript_8007/g.8797  ORF Transcript_8007/g.8797 Transcript_8007/m.8797 type:complete len:261 (+) Transcript_8007:106-888(+)